MGDYNKLIVACTVRGVTKEELQQKVNDLELHDSAYQSQEQVVSIEPNDWSMKKESLNVVLVGQTKWGDRQDEFLRWLKPFVSQGSGSGDVFAMQFSEYGIEPVLWAMEEIPDKRGQLGSDVVPHGTVETLLRVIERMELGLKKVIEASHDLNNESGYAIQALSDVEKLCGGEK